MVYEVAHISVIAGKESEFEAGVQQALALFHRAHGCRSVELHRSIEHPSRFVLFVQWDTVEDHMVRFRGSEDFQEWRRLVGHFFEKPPAVLHTQITVK